MRIEVHCPDAGPAGTSAAVLDTTIQEAFRGLGQGHAHQWALLRPGEKANDWTHVSVTGRRFLVFVASFENPASRPNLWRLDLGEVFGNSDAVTVTGQGERDACLVDSLNELV